MKLENHGSATGRGTGRADPSKRFARSRRRENHGLEHEIDGVSPVGA